MSFEQIPVVLLAVRGEADREAEVLREIGRQRAVESRYATWAGKVVPEEVGREHTARLSALLAV